jgi:hypothetical protein
MASPAAAGRKLLALREGGPAGTAQNNDGIGVRVEGRHEPLRLPPAIGTQALREFTNISDDHNQPSLKQ